MRFRGREGRERNSRPREMFPAKCADCGVETQVPFKPAPDRPVYCQECYKKHRPARRRF
ncbi:MAG: CxxC-x17-CxxC domain-containing protein [Halobacteria archaeon]